MAYTKSCLLTVAIEIPTSLLALLAVCRAPARCFCMILAPYFAAVLYWR